MTIAKHQSNLTKNQTQTGENISLFLDPPVIDFLDVEANVKYIQKLRIKNESRNPRRIRLEHPVSSEIRVVNVNQQAIAPGLSVHILLYY